MDCPKCSQQKMKVTHTVKAGSAGKTQRHECPVCHTSAVCVVMLAAVNPAFGQGAHATAKRMMKDEAAWPLPFVVSVQSKSSGHNGSSVGSNPV